MSSPNRTFALTCAAAVIAAATVVADTPQAGQTRQTRAVPVKIAGCIDRLLPAGAPPKAPELYKLINTQPGRTQVSGGDTTSRPPQPPVVLDAEYLLVGVKPMDFAKYQNQRVEVTGIAGMTQPPAGTKAGDLPKRTLTITDVQVLATECKATER